MKSNRLWACLSAAVMLFTAVAPYSAQAAVLKEESAGVIFIQEGDEEDPADSLLYQDIPVTEFWITDYSAALAGAGEVETRIAWEYSIWEDCRYLFLPPFADRSQLRIHFSTDPLPAETTSPEYEASLLQKNDVLTLNGQAVADNAVTGLLSTADSFEIALNGESWGELRIMQSDRACMFLSTEHGGTDYLDHHRYETEYGSIAILEPDGTANYSGELEWLKSHGNSSWDYSDKKPYNFKLPKKADLCGLGKAKKWVLLGNYLDHSMMRNAAAFELSRQLGMESVMDTAFIDLWSDGSYRGTYQLCEKVQVQKQRVNIRDLGEETEKLNELPLEEYGVIAAGAYPNEYKENSFKAYDAPNNPDDITGGYLLQFQLWNRYPKKAKSGFVTTRGQAIQVCTPEYCTHKQILYIRDFVQELEDAIYSETGYNKQGKHYSDYIDVDSLAVAYLVQEIMQNADGTYTSFYLWKDSDTLGDGKLHFSPTWDFDFSCRNFFRLAENVYDEKKAYTGRIEDLYVASMPIHGYASDPETSMYSGRPTYGASWICELFHHHPEFVRRVIDLYQTRAAGILSTITDPENGTIIQLRDDLSASAEMNNARWHMFGDTAYMNGKPYKKLGPVNGWNFTECAEYLRDFLERRTDALNTSFMNRYADLLCVQLTDAYEALPLEKYDEEGLAALQALIEEETANVHAQPTPADAEAALAAALPKLDLIPRAWIRGDFNDDLSIDLTDATALLHYYARTLTGLPAGELSPTEFHNGDVNTDGVLDALDAMHVLRYYAAALAGEEYEYPDET